MPEIAFDYAEANGVRIHYAHAGEGPLIVFLHGYPRHWYLWRHQLRHFAEDHLAVAWDQRGYNLSSKPERDVDYGVWHAVEDLRALVDALGYERFTLVGHDWGGGVAWSFALHYPERLERLVVLSAPHPAMADEAMRESPEYREIAKYIFNLRDPQAPELFAANDFALLRKMGVDFPFLSDEDRAAYVEAWSRPGAMRSMLAIDRREGLGPATDEAPARGNYVPELMSLVVHVPTLVMYTRGDPINHPDLFEGIERWVPDVSVKVFDGTHWMPEELPNLVNREIRAFSGAFSVSATG